jgi:uncharacterized protein
MADQPPWPFSRETTIVLDREGVFWHDGQRVDHPGLAQAFASWIDVDPDTGRYILRNSINWAYITVEDAPFQVRALDGWDVVLSDGTREPLDVQSLRLGENDVPYCTVKGRFPARFSRGAMVTLLERARAEGERYVLDTPDGEVGL